MKRHKTFLSFHHANDQDYKDHLGKILAGENGVFISKAVNDGDIDPKQSTETIRQTIRDEFIRDATVTIVLIGTDTWKRKHIDWEIASSIRATKKNSRTGLIGILLPSYESGTFNLLFGEDCKYVENPYWKWDKYYPYNIPPRLHSNIEAGFAKMYKWSESPVEVKSWIEEAFSRRDKIDPDNSYPPYKINRPENQDNWK